MIIESTQGKLSGSIDAVEDIQMSFDEDSIGFLMASISSNLYADPYRAVLREYTSNALDSHVRAGQTRPVEVSLPTSLNPNLTIRDFGVGLSLEDVRRIYSKFGGSDKRATNGERGGFGLGSKSALSIASQFTYIATKDGVRHTVVVSAGEDSIPVMRVLSSEQCDEGNGVTVIIPASDSERMATCADSLFLTIEPGKLLVNGAAPVNTVHNPERYIPIAGRGWLSASRRHGRGRLDVLGVHYPVPKGVDVPAVLRNLDYVAVIPNGDVTFSTSRDNIIPTPRTTQNIAAALSQFADAVTAHFTSAVNAAATACEALQVTRHAPTTIELTWQGHTVPQGTVSLGVETQRVGRDRHDSGFCDSVTVHAGTRYTHAAGAHTIVNAARAIRREDADWAPLLVGSVPFEQLPLWARASLEEVPAEALLEQAREIRRAQRDPSRKRAAYTGPKRLRVADTAHSTTWMNAAELTPESKVAYLHGQDDISTGIARTLATDIGSRNIRRAGSHLHSALTDAGWLIVLLRKSDNPDVIPGAVPLAEAVASIVPQLMEPLTDEFILTTRASRHPWLYCLGQSGVDADDLLDPEVRELYRAWELNHAHTHASLLHFVKDAATADTECGDEHTKQFADIAGRWSVNLPYRPELLRSMYGAAPSAEQVVIYMNALYAAYRA